MHKAIIHDETGLMKKIYDSVTDKGVYPFMLGERLYSNEGDKFTGCDNSDGNAWTDTFDDLKSCIEWLEGKYDLGDRHCNYEYSSIKYNKIAYGKVINNDTSDNTFGHFLICDDKSSHFYVCLKVDDNYVCSHEQDLVLLSVHEITSIEDLQRYCKNNGITYDSNCIGPYEAFKMFNIQHKYVLQDDLTLCEFKEKTYGPLIFKVEDGSSVSGYTDFEFWNGSPQPVFTKEQADIVIYQYDPNHEYIQWDDELKGYWVAFSAGCMLTDCKRSEYDTRLANGNFIFAKPFEIIVGSSNVTVYSITDGWCWEVDNDRRPDITRITQLVMKYLYQLSEYIGKYDTCDLSCKQFPFNQSFDEIVSMMSDWMYGYVTSTTGRQPSEWLDLDKLGHIDSVDSVFTKIEDYYKNKVKLQEFCEWQDNLYQTNTDNVDDLISFESQHGQMVVNPFRSECTRFAVDPIEHYGSYFIENIWKFLRAIAEKQ